MILPIEKKSKKLLSSQKTKLLNSTKMAALGEMASVIAHEINNPLTVILGNATTIKTLNKSQKIDPVLLNKKVEKIESTVQRMSKIISGLKAISRNAESDPMDMVNIKGVINDSLILSQEKFKRENNELILDFDQSDIFILGRNAQITQVIINLLNNSIDAGSEKEDPWTKIIVKTNSSQVEISVIDSGSGIEPEILERLMQPFFTTKPVGKGTGLGLSISKGVIEDHNGSFNYDPSYLNTCFTIRLPLAPKS